MNIVKRSVEIWINFANFNKYIFNIQISNPFNISGIIFNL